MTNSRVMPDAAMRMALKLAQRGAGRVWPNPSVGAVVFRGTRILGRGTTEAPGWGACGDCCLALCRASLWGARSSWGFAGRDPGALQPYGPHGPLRRGLDRSGSGEGVRGLSRYERASGWARSATTSPRRSGSRYRSDAGAVPRRASRLSLRSGTGPSLCHLKLASTWMGVSLPLRVSPAGSRVPRRVVSCISCADARMPSR